MVLQWKSLDKLKWKIKTSVSKIRKTTKGGLCWEAGIEHWSFFSLRSVRRNRTGIDINKRLWSLDAMRLIMTWLSRICKLTGYLSSKLSFRVCTICTVTKTIRMSPVKLLEGMGVLHKPTDAHCQENKIAISNSNWTEWSTIQGVIARVISKSYEREARDRFEITSTVTPWIVRHEVQLLINRIYNKFRN